MSGEIVIRETVPADLAAIVEVHKKGFGYDKEAGLTAELLSDPTAEPAVSLCATGRPSATSYSPDAASQAPSRTGRCSTSSHRSPSFPPARSRASADC